MDQWKGQIVEPKGFLLPHSLKSSILKTPTLLKASAALCLMLPLSEPAALSSFLLWPINRNKGKVQVLQSLERKSV